MDRWYTVIDRWRSGEANSKTDDVDIMNTNHKENTKPLETISAQDRGMNQNESR